MDLLKAANQKRMLTLHLTSIHFKHFVTLTSNSLRANLVLLILDTVYPFRKAIES